MKLVVAVCVGGTDYNANFPGKSFGTSRKVACKIEEHLPPDVMLAKVGDLYHVTFILEIFFLCRRHALLLVFTDLDRNGCHRVQVATIFSRHVPIHFPHDP